MVGKYMRGSEWRRWELHLHTPFTKKNDNYTGSTPEEKWDKFYDAINDYVGDGTDPLRTICAIAITDYLSIDNYLKVKADDRLPSCVKLLLPNIEMRMIPIAQDSPINIHCLFSPEIDYQIESRFLSKLKDANGHTASKTELVRLGREHENNNNLDEDIAYKTGIEQFVVTSDAIKKIFQDDPELRNKVIIAVSNKSGDGVSGIVSHSDFFTENGSQLDSTRQGIYKMSDIIFSATPKDRDYFLGKGVDSSDEVKRKCGSLKPCVHGCDAHGYERFLEPTEERYCWIKADPTFEGFKQILYEPKDRVFIGNTLPDEKPGYYVIDRVEIIGNDNFSPAPIFFNDKLTCIIGGKSTGKSLLLNSTANTIDTKQVSQKIEIAPTKVKPIQEMQVYWRDGHVSTLHDSEEKKRKIVYIPQAYLNRLSDDKEHMTEIDDIIQDIVLQNYDANQAFIMQNKNIEEYKQQLYKNILELITCDSRIKDLKREKMDIGDESGIRTEISRLKGELDKLSESSGVTESDMKEYQENVESLKKTKEHINLLNNEKMYIESLATVISPIELSPDTITYYSSKFKEAVTAVTQIADQKWLIERNKIIELISDEISQLEASCSSKQEVIDRLKPQMDNHAQIDHLTKVIESENEKIGRIEKINKQLITVKERFDALLDNIANSFEYFKEQHIVFADVINSNQSINSQDMEFKVDVVFKAQEYISKVSSLLNNKSFRYFTPFTNVENINEQNLSVSVFKELVLSLLSEDSDTLKVKGNNTTETALRELFTDFYNINYVVKMENDVIHDMSPGKKALVLLRLLISLAESRCPILIDQPEDDLDNRSIFDELIEFIKEKKSLRQIIIVTHNANVVLGGDAELVIVANQHGRDTSNKESKFEYREGSIENNVPLYKVDGTIEDGILNQCGIQTHICQILEGGERAFELRRNKYRFIY